MNTPFTLAAWNLFQGLHNSSKRGNWIQNVALADHLRAMDSDVIVLPEAWRFRELQSAWAEELAEQLGYQLHQWVSDEPSRVRDIAPWRMVMMTRIESRPLPPQVMPAFGKFGPRAIVRAELVESGLTVAAAHLFGIHLLLQRTPREWMKERAELRAACQANDIVAGDLNMWGPIVRSDAAPSVSAVRGRTFPAKRPHSQIDHILVSSQVEVLKSDVLPDLGSDHRAVTATLQRRA